MTSHLRSQFRLVPRLVPLQREDVEGGLDGGRADVGVSVGEHEHRLLGVGPRVEQDLVGPTQGRVRGRVAVRLLPLDVVVDATVQSALVLAVAIETGRQVVHVNTRRRAEESNVLVIVLSSWCPVCKYK